MLRNIHFKRFFPGIRLLQRIKLQISAIFPVHPYPATFIHSTQIQDHLVGTFLGNMTSGAIPDVAIILKSLRFQIQPGGCGFPSAAVKIRVIIPFLFPLIPGIRANHPSLRQSLRIPGRSRRGRRQLPDIFLYFIKVAGIHCLFRQAAAQFLQIIPCNALLLYGRMLTGKNTGTTGRGYRILQSLA